MFKLAGEAAVKRDDNRFGGRHYKLGSVGVRGDGALVSASNLLSPVPNREMHAEYRLSKMLDYGATVYVARVLGNGEFGMAMPCRNCLKALKQKRVKKVYFTTGDDDFGVLYLS